VFGGTAEMKREMKGRKGEKHKENIVEEGAQPFWGGKTHTHTNMADQQQPPPWPVTYTVQNVSHILFLLPSIFIYSKSDAILFRQFI
jgi:hypothetical protein